MHETTNTSVYGATRDGTGVRFSRDAATVVLTLDRQATLNALDSGMKTAIANEIPRIARDPQVYAVVIEAAPGRMFSAGGDIRELYDLTCANPAQAIAECAREYALIWLLDCFSKPAVALIDGAVMGTGAGIVQAVTHRAAGPGYRFQMPETAIGFFPDNGVCWHLARLPAEIGTWLGLTGAAIGRADAYMLELVTHCVAAESFGRIKDELANAQPIDELLAKYHTNPGPPPIAQLAPVIERCFSANSIAEIVARLAAETSERDWCEKTMAILEARSPTALEVTLQHLRRARHLDFRQTLVADQRLAARLIAENDFLNSVRALIVEKRGQPRWRPAALSDLGAAQIERYFLPLEIGELRLPSRQEMQMLRAQIG